MSYIVPAELPKDCHHCRFSDCKFSHPFWLKENPRNTKGFVCSLDKEKRVLEMGYDDFIKAEWCPLREEQK